MVMNRIVSTKEGINTCSRALTRDASVRFPCHELESLFLGGQRDQFWNEAEKRSNATSRLPVEVASRN
jgi:hypothetical protein